VFIDIVCKKVIISTFNQGFFYRGMNPRFSSGFINPNDQVKPATLVKWRSTWTITSKTSPTIPNDPPWSTFGQDWSNPSQNPI
jgi:hypothetical protein